MKTSEYSIKDLADKQQMELYKQFPASHSLSNPTILDNFFRWNTFFRRNFHRYAIDYLGINLYEYQALTLYELGANQHVAIVASRAAAKSFLIALYACIRCILYPNTKILLSSATRGQSELIVTDKIQAELMNWSPILAREIISIKSNQNNRTVVKFASGSQITVVVANDNARGCRSNAIVREECRQINKAIDDSVLSPCQVLRQAPYMLKEPYCNMPELKEEPVDVYITSSWFDGHWMWQIVDTYYDEMKAGKPSCVLAFDESVILKHNIKSQEQLIGERKKQDKITFSLEFLNLRLRENSAAFFTYAMLQQNQIGKQPFYPRKNEDVLMNKKNPYAIPKQKGEIRIVACDMAFVTRKGNDNSIFSCMRLLPETETHSGKDQKSIEIDAGYRRVVSWIESRQGGDIDAQALRIRQLFNDWDADYIVLDMRNGGIAVYDKLAKIMYDEERRLEYSPLTCMNDDNIASRVKSSGAIPCIYVVNATQTLNSDIAMDFHRVLEQKKIDFLIPFETAKEDILSKNKEYLGASDAETQLFFERPFLETQAFINETTSLIYEKKEQTGAIVIREQGNMQKDRYTSINLKVALYSDIQVKSQLKSVKFLKKIIPRVRLFI